MLSIMDSFVNLDFCYNQFDGEFFVGFGQGFGYFQWLVVSYNKFFGSLLDIFMGFKYFIFLDLSYNYFMGNLLLLLGNLVNF